jgi:hypothetical protein
MQNAMRSMIWMIRLSLRRPGWNFAPEEEFKMTNLEGMPAYFWLVSPQLKTSARDDIPYTAEALKQDLLRVQNAWEESQARRDRDAIYGYLAAVFELVAWWAAEGRALERAQKALQLRRIIPFDHEEPFAVIIRCTADPAKVDKRTRSKWSRALRWALYHKSHSERLDQFMKRKGGINCCASLFTSCLGRKIHHQSIGDRQARLASRASSQW